MEITVKIDKRSKQAKAVLEMLKTFDFVKFEKPRYNKETENAIKEVKSDKATRISLTNFRKQLYS
jgi:hypothetical protein